MVMHTLRHVEGDSEAPLCDSLSEGGKAGPVERKGSAHENVQNHTQTL